jgi:hypothetical protein
LNWGKAFQPPFLHWSLLVGAISTGWARDEVKVSVNVAAESVNVAGNPRIVTFTADKPSSWKFPLGVWIVAAYGRPVKLATAGVPGRLKGSTQLSDPCTVPASVLLPVIVVVPEVVVNVALKTPFNCQPPVSVNAPG